MKTKFLVISFILIFISGSISANALIPVVEKPQKGIKQLKKRIAKFISYPLTKEIEKTDESVDVIFSVNKDSEIELISVESQDEKFVSYVKKALQGKKIEVEPEVIGYKYKIKFTFRYL